MTFPDLPEFIDDADKAKRNKALSVVVFVLLMAVIALVAVHLLFEAIISESYRL